jgi:septal ring factor EnvC (AmiA/AmiB activator)
MDRPPPPSHEPPPSGDPTQPTRPIGRSVEREVVPAESEVVLDPMLAEKIDSASFWSKVGSAIAVLAAIIGVIALIIALGNDNNSGDGQSNADLQRQVDQIQSDVSQVKQDVSSKTASSSQIDRLSSRISKLEGQVTQISDDQKQTSQDVAKVQQDLADLTDRVDQVEKAQEQAAAGGP